MKLTKYEHACFVVEKDHQSLVVDPGAFTTDFVIPTNVIGVVITHQHPDHFDKDTIRRIFTTNPKLTIITPKDVADQMPSDIPVHVVAANETMVLGTFTLQFFGGEHARIHTSLPRPQNLGVLIDSQLYYPGDALVAPSRPIDTLALPVTAPWLKISEVMDFLAAVHPRQVFPTHDAIASDTGKALVDRMLTSFAEEYGSTYQRLTEPLMIP